MNALPENDMAVPHDYQIHRRSTSTWTASKLESGLRMTLLGSNGEAKLFRRPYKAAVYCREHHRKKLSYREAL